MMKKVINRQSIILALLGLLVAVAVIGRAGSVSANSTSEDGCDFSLSWADGSDLISAAPGETVGIIAKHGYRTGCYNKNNLWILMPSGEYMCLDGQGETNYEYVSKSIRVGDPATYAYKMYAAITSCSSSSPGVRTSDPYAYITAIVKDAGGSTNPGNNASSDFKINKGPTLSNLKSTSVIVSWETDTASNSDVIYGEEVGPNMSLKPGKDFTLKVHSQTLTGLKPATKYYYRVRSTTTDDKTATTDTANLQSFITKNADGTGGNTNAGTNTNPGESAQAGYTPSNQQYYGYENALYDQPSSIGLFNPLDGSVDTLPQFLVRLAKILFLLLGSIAVIVILIGGFRMIASQGNSEGLTTAKRTITWAIIGLVVALLSYSIVAILQAFIG